jgi:4-diphosphocytidyl-2-C-methyl-D-erythritol kinase
MFGRITLRAGAKVNLSLDVLGRRPDGYHDIVSVFQATALRDTLILRKTAKPGIRLVTDDAGLPDGQGNIVWRAMERMLRKTASEQACGLACELRKSIPVSAGLGGGSADCAAALTGAARLLGADVSALPRIGAELGADVPFFFVGGTALVTGVGADVSALPDIPPCFLVVVKPPFAVSTAEAFALLDGAKIRNRPDTERLLAGIRAGDVREVCRGMGNALESVTAARFPVIGELKAKLMERGAMGASMSGSGPSVFGVFADGASARAAAREISREYPGWNDIFVERTARSAIL